MIESEKKPPSTFQLAPVSEALRALLDTTAGGRAAADTRLGLEVGLQVRTFYGPAAAPIWTQGTDSLTADAAALLTLLKQAPNYGLRAEDYATRRLLTLRDSLFLRQPTSSGLNAARQARFDVYLTDAALRFMIDLHRGRLQRHQSSPLERAADQALQPALVLRQGLAAGQATTAVLACQPQHREYQRLQAALARWLRQPVAPDSAARRQAQYEQVALNLERWRREAIPDSTYLLINIPAFTLQVVSTDSVLRQHRVIVGKPQTSTPTLSSVIKHFTLAPDWHVPHSIATKEILPRLKQDAGYLGRNNFALYNNQGRLLDPYQINWRQVSARNFPYAIRQSAGCDNALGNIVFRFKNSYSVYLHDTPVRQAFTYPMRALSHGCIRVEHPFQLAAFLLRRGGQNVQLPTENECARQPRPQDVPLAQPIAVHIRYATCAAEEGSLRFYPDIYGHDAALRRQLQLVRSAQ
jgi:murein L,D-transpeptidase YcbB/YkuD